MYFNLIVLFKWLICVMKLKTLFLVTSPKIEHCLMLVLFEIEKKKKR